jgi:hypothetical protein
MISLGILSFNPVEVFTGYNMSSYCLRKVLTFWVRSGSGKDHFGFITLSLISQKSFSHTLGLFINYFFMVQVPWKGALTLSLSDLFISCISAHYLFFSFISCISAHYLFFSFNSCISAHYLFFSFNSCISAHYLFFSLIFLYAAPITFVLLPVVLFAVLHSASYSLTLLDTLGKANV